MKLSFAFVALVGATTHHDVGQWKLNGEKMDENQYQGGKVNLGMKDQSSQDDSQHGFDHGIIHQFDSVDDAQPMSSEDVLTKFLYKRSASDNDATVAKVKAGILEPTAFPTPMPSEHYMDRTDDRNLCVQWHVSNWEDEFSARGNMGCSTKCGGGERKQSRFFSAPSAASLAQENRQACDYGVTPQGASLGWPDQATLVNGHQYQTTTCNTGVCPTDCQLDPVTDDNWSMGYDANNKPIMKSVQAIGIHPENGFINGVETAGKACPSLAQRTRVRTWGQHCENVILKDCKNGEVKTGCVTKGAWSACDTSTNFMYRETVKKTCNHESATGMVMTYKEARNCGASTTDNTQGADLGHFRSATGSSGSPGMSLGGVPNDSQGKAGNDQSTPDHNTFDAYPNQQQEAYTATQGASE